MDQGTYSNFMGRGIKEQKEYLPAEKWLLLAVLALGIILDRVLFNDFFKNENYIGYGIFWLCYLVVFYIFTWKKSSKSIEGWVLAACALAICIWFVFFDQMEIKMLNLVAIPCLLMLHAQVATSTKTIGKSVNLILMWLLGWLMLPFVAINRAAGAVASLFSKKSSRKTKEFITGVLIAVPVLAVVLALLSGADWVFGRFFQELFYGFDIGSIILHSILILIVAALFYSFINSISFENQTKEFTPKGEVFEPVTMGITVGLLLVAYLFFTYVQFRYLFGTSGLPQGMNYSDYARSGFFQLLVVIAINLGLFGATIRYAKKSRMLIAMLGALLVMTGVMIVSAFVRQGLYIDAYGYTWLRTAAYTFTIFLSAVTAVYFLRLFLPKLPLLKISFLLLVAWYITFGYMNVDNVIASSKIVTVDAKYCSKLSDDAVPALINYSKSSQEAETRLYLKERLMKLQSMGTHNLSSLQAKQLLEDYLK